jgi:predicted alpha/beta hydrolase family esterase
MKKKVIFVHGYGLAAPLETEDWPGTLGCELKKQGFDFQLLLMPEAAYPAISEWLIFLVKQNIKVNENTYFVGHSLGCITIARFLEKLPEGVMAGGCVFVSGFCSLPQIPLLKEFCNLPLDFSEVKRHSRDFAVVVSDNDHIIPLVRSQELAERLGARVIVERNMGHFISGVKEVPSVLNTILEMAQMTEERKEMKN